MLQYSAANIDSSEIYIMVEILIKILVCLIAGAGAGIGTGFAGMSAAAVIGPMLTAFLGVPAYDAVGIGLISDVLASLISAYTYKKSGNLDVKNSLPLLAIEPQNARSVEVIRYFALIPLRGKFMKNY